MIVDSFPFLGQILRFGHDVHDFSGELSLLNWALNDSMKPFCHGNPVSMDAMSDHLPMRTANVYLMELSRWVFANDDAFVPGEYFALIPLCFVLLVQRQPRLPVSTGQ